MSRYRHLSADPVILVGEEVVLIRRKGEVEDGSWVLPGGMVEMGETASETAVREAKEEVGLEVEVDTFLGLFDSVDRDQRGNVSAAYLCRAEGESKPVPREEAYEAGLFPLDEPPEPIGFDHCEILAEAARYVSERQR